MEEITILIADDHEIFRKGLEVTLKRLLFVSKILHASNGTEALEQIESTPVQVVFMDIRMPEMDGITTTMNIRKKNATVKVIALSMMDDKASIVQMFKAGANGYLLKNTNKLELTDAIQQVMAGNRYYSREVSEMLLRRDLDQLPLPKKSKIITELTSREMEVLTLICHQYSTREMAEMLCLSEKTIEGHRKKLLDKTSSKNIAGLVYYALEQGLIKNGG